MTKAKPFARAGSEPTPVKAEIARVSAYQRLFNGNGTNSDAEIVLTDLADTFGYYRRPSYTEWLKKRTSADGFELHSALCNARAEVIQHILDAVLLDRDRLVELEKASRLER